MKPRVEQKLIQDAQVIMAGELWQKLYNPENNLDTFALCNLMKYHSKIFVDELKQKGFKGDGNDELDFLIELGEYENKVLSLYGNIIHTKHGDFRIVEKEDVIDVYSCDNSDHFFTFGKGTSTSEIIADIENEYEANK